MSATRGLLRQYTDCTAQAPNCAIHEYRTLLAASTNADSYSKRFRRSGGLGTAAGSTPDLPTVRMVLCPWLQSILRQFPKEKVGDATGVSRRTVQGRGTSRRMPRGAVSNLVGPLPGAA
ncbi:MAG TPA: hypothetical protein VN829_20260 [Dongiaceae bacterium]|nr:hypothetical protein [Dongiaceae bacterium]